MGNGAQMSVAQMDLPLIFNPANHRANATAVAARSFPKKYQKKDLDDAADEGVYIRQDKSHFSKTILSNPFTALLIDSPGQ